MNYIIWERASSKGIKIPFNIIGDIEQIFVPVPEEISRVVFLYIINFNVES